MYGFVKSAVVAAVTASVFTQVVSHDHPPLKRRKSLGFGPQHPRATFVSTPDKIYENHVPVWFSSEADPFLVANQFVSTLLEKGNLLSERSSYVVRDDSYTDSTTGVTHVYVRQVVNGLQVIDGDINLNIKDGIVLSYGDSFYRGAIHSFNPIPKLESNVINQLAAHCEALANGMVTSAPSYSRQSEQIPLGQTAMSQKSAESDILAHLYFSNCIMTKPQVMDYQLGSSDKSNALSDSFSSPIPAILRFMIAATPDPVIAQQIMDSFRDNTFSAGLSETIENQFHGSYTEMLYKVHQVPGTINPVKAHLAYVQLPHDDSTILSRVWKIIVEMEDNWYEAAVGTEYPFNIMSVVDWASDAPMAPIPKEPTEHESASYNVFKWGINDPSQGNRSMEKESVDKLASPIGWHRIPVENYPAFNLNDEEKQGEVYVNGNTTIGNNVIAHENWEGRNNWLYNGRPVSSDMVFNYTYEPVTSNGTGDPLAEAHKYINTTVTQLFYTTNMIHDIYYRYGFDELSGNFQQHNFGRGGRENDAIIANAQDGSGYNNANFMTPPDGDNGRCRMYLWNTGDPYRDGDLEAGIIIHEVTHGMSTRLTGGPANSGCLGFGEAGGMGEGWGDFLATTIRSTRNYSDFAMGDWAANRDTGIRNYKYSLNITTNPSTYKYLDRPAYWGVHAIGEVWAQILWIVSNRIIEKHGFSDTLYPPIPLEDGLLPENDFYRPTEYDQFGKPKPVVPKHGNSLMVQLVMDGMKLQPCRPSFFDARDAIIQADQLLTNGENFCDLWNGFSERGLGPDAKIVGQTPWGGGIRTDGYSTHTLCKKENIPEEPGDGDDDDDDDDEY